MQPGHTTAISCVTRVIRRDEFPRYVSWGHSTWQEGVRLCDQAGVKRLVIFHHDPGHDDDFMDEVAKAAEACRPGTTVAREGLVLRP